MFDVNVIGLLYATDAAVEAMKRQGGGHLVNISSLAGRKVTRDSSGVYAGTKFAVGAISEGLQAGAARRQHKGHHRRARRRRDRTPRPTSPTRTPKRASAAC